MRSRTVLTTILLASITNALPQPSLRFEDNNILPLLNLVRRFLSPRQYNGDTFNQLVDGTACRKVTVIYARGTTQDGNVGDSEAVGPLMFNALAASIGVENLAVQGVDYSASILGFLAGGDSKGAQKMADLVNTVCSRFKSTGFH
jgi:hypothetical protein